MKYIITGLHASGKHEVLSHLSSLDIKCGKNFTNLEDLPTDVYGRNNFEIYSNDDINDVFENKAYVFIQELSQSPLNFKVGRYYEGLSAYTFDQNDVFVMSPDQVLSIAPGSLNDEVCFVWLDNTKDNRSARYHREKRTYNYNEREVIERRDLGSYVKSLYGTDNTHVLYFNDEMPLRVATIIYNLIKHPDMFNTFIKNFD